MNIQIYLKLKNIINNDISTKEQRRGFALKHNITALPKLQQLLFWQEHHKNSFEEPSTTLTTLQTFVVLSAFIFGILTATTLLSYDGKHPVNILYFFSIAVLLPLFSMLVSLFFPLFPKFITSFSLTHLIEKIYAKLLHVNTNTISLTPTVESKFLFFTMQLSGFVFSLGLLLAFLAIIFTQDIAFGWSTTLHITAQSLYSFLENLSFVFTPFCPQSALSLELIEKSHYFRLGHSVTQEMQNNAELFGGWWQFLACSTLFYAIILRLFFVVGSYIALKKALLHSLLYDSKAQQLLQDMNEPIITTVAQEEEVSAPTQTSHQQKTKITEGYFAILGWSTTQEELLLASEALQLQAQHIYTLGGTNTLDEDTQIIEKLHGDVVMIIKAWEVPTMEFIDILEEMQEYVEHIHLHFIGYASQQYKPNPDDVAIWHNKIKTQNLSNVSFL